MTQEKTKHRTAMTVIADTLTNTTDNISQQVLHPGSRALFRYWETLRAERACPQRSDLQLKDIPSLVPHLFIWDWDAAKQSFIYRLSGTFVDYLNCKTMTGEDAFAGWDNFERDVMGRVFRVAHEKLHPGLVRMRLFSGFNEAIGAEMLILPMRSDDGRSVQLFGGLFCFTEPVRLALNKIVSRQLVTSRVIWTEHEGLYPLDGAADYAAPETQLAPKLPFRVIRGGRTD
jgi:hypothetical protein